MRTYRWVWIGLLAVLALVVPVSASAAGVSFAAPSGLPSLPALYGVTCPSATTCIAVGGVSAGTIVTTTDGGRHWSTLEVAGTSAFTGTSCIDSSHCVAVGDSGSTASAVAVTTDGRTWRAISSPPSGTGLGSVSCVQSHCLAVGSTFSSSTGTTTANVYSSSDGGQTWVAGAVPTHLGVQGLLNAVQCLGAHRCFAVGGGAWVSNDFGGSWHDITPPDGCANSTSTTGFCSPTYSDLTGVAFTDASHGVVVGGEQCGGQGVTKCPSVYFATSNAGESWRLWPASNSSIPFFNAVHCVAGTCLVGSDSYTTASVLLTNDGVSFTNVGGGAAGEVSSITCAPGGLCVAVGVGAGGTGVLLVSNAGLAPGGGGGGGTAGGVAGSGGAGPSNAMVSSFSTSLPTPTAVGNSVPALLFSALLVLALVLLVVFPSQLFNRTYEENHDRIRAWWERRLPWTRAERQRAETHARRRAIALPSAVIVGAVLGTLLDLKVGLNARTAALFTGIVVSFLFSISLGTAVTAAYRRARGLGTHWQLHALPSGLVVAGVCVLVSRLVGFQPGYLYGIIGGIAFVGALSGKEEGRLVALSSAVTLVVAVLAWLLWVPVSTAAARPGAGFGMALLSNVLSALFVGGLAGVVLSLIPLRLLPGEKLAAWHWGAWAAVFALGMFGLVQIMLRPQSEAAHVASVPLWTTVGLFVAFGTASVAFWAYFRTAQPRGAPAEEGPRAS